MSKSCRIPNLAPRNEARTSPRRSRQSGFALLLALFLMLLLLIASTAAVTDLRMEKRRQREDELVWRGNQYVRAIRLYYHKTGHYPQNLDDLEKGLPDLHFLRYAAYKDPMNKNGGDFRFIYVNATGQIIGSVKYASLQQMALMDLNGGQLPGTSQGQLSALSMSPFGASANPSANPAATAVPQAQSAAAPASTAPTSVASAPPTDPNAAQSSVSGQPGQPGQPAQTPAAPTTPPTQSPSQPGVVAFGNPVAQQPTGPVDGPVLGAFLTGVASKVDAPSVKVYNRGTNYNQWEFIWNPIEDQARAIQQGIGQIQNPNLLGQPGAAGLPGATPAGANSSPFGASGIGGATASPFGGPGVGGSAPLGGTPSAPATPTQ